MRRLDGVIGRLATIGALIALALAGVFAVAARGDDPAPAAPPSLLNVNVANAHVNLGMLATPGATVTFYEQIGDTRTELGKASSVAPPSGTGLGLASIPAVPWVCERQARQFAADAVAPDGTMVEATNIARTPDCRDRIALVAPTRVAKGAKIPITLKDRWQIGDLKLKVCTARSTATKQCSAVTLAPGQKSVSFTRAAGAGVGVLDIDLAVAGFHHHQKVGVGRAVPVDKNLPIALVTGDSLTEGIDTLLSKQLQARYRVIGKARPGTGVSTPTGKKWTIYAREEASKIKPALTVVLLGVNDGYPMTTASGGTVNCCDESWRAEYLARITAMADAFLRNGRSKLVWALLPPPKRADIAGQIDAVNDAIRRLGQARPQIQVVPLDQVFGPEYHDTINGQQVRDVDGLHFSLAGQRIAAKAIVAAIHTAETKPDTTTVG